MADSTPQNAGAWQGKLDSDFPHGVVMSWAHEEWTYLVPWVQVTGMKGLDPLLFWLTDGLERSFGPWALLSYDPFQESPHLLVRVQFEGEGRAMVWSASVPGRAARSMAPLRTEAMARAIAPA